MRGGSSTDDVKTKISATEKRNNRTTLSSMHLVRQSFGAYLIKKVQLNKNKDNFPATIFRYMHDIFTISLHSVAAGFTIHNFVLPVNFNHNPENEHNFCSRYNFSTHKSNQKFMWREIWSSKNFDRTAGNGKLFKLTTEHFNRIKIESSTCTKSEKILTLNLMRLTLDDG